MENESFWQKENVEELLKKYYALKSEIEEIENLEKEILSAKEKDLEKIEKKIFQKEIETLFSGKYDQNDAILYLRAGQGGKDAEDFCAILWRMYQRWLQKKGFDYEVLDQSFGEVGPEGRIGLKSILVEVKGKYAFGFLKGENGVHRLVRISPFSAKGLRHTSFCLVEVLPKIKPKEIKIKESDLEFQFFKSSGAGGQYVNKRMSAVRVIHLPTKISVVCQTERSQLHNKVKALEILASKLNQLLEKEKVKEIEKLKGKKIQPSWGNQIRNYILDPYKLVKDLRTKVEKRDVEKVFDGEIDEFLEAEIFYLKEKETT